MQRRERKRVRQLSEDNEIDQEFDKRMQLIFLCFVFCINRQQKKYLILLGYDKKAFYVLLDNKKVFPDKNPSILPLHDRYNLKKNDDLTLYWMSNENRLWEPITARFKAYAATQELAESMCDLLAVKLLKPDGGSTISGSTNRILDIDLSPLRSSTPNDLAAPPDDSIESSVELTQQELRVQLKKDRAQELKNLATKASGSKHSSRNNLPPNSRFEQVLTELKNVATCFEILKGEMERMNERVDNLESSIQKQNTLLKEVKNAIVVKKNIEHVQTADKLLAEDDDKMDWLVEKVNVAVIVNDLYLESGRNVMEFIKELAKKFYGDLLAVYKFNVQRNYVDRNQRKSLERLDPIGKQIITYVLSKYCHLHSDELKNTETQQKLSVQQFYDYAYNAIDTFGSMANYKRHRREVFVTDTLFYQFVIEKNMKPIDSFTEDDRNEMLVLYEDMKVPKETHKEAKRKRVHIAQTNNPGPSTKKNGYISVSSSNN